MKGIEMEDKARHDEVKDQSSEKSKDSQEGLENESQNTKSNYDLNSYQKSENSQTVKNIEYQRYHLSSVKQKAYIMMICYALAYFVIPLIVALVFHIMLVLELQRVSGRKGLLSNLMLSIILPIVSFLPIFIALFYLVLNYGEVLMKDFVEELLGDNIWGNIILLIIVLPAYYFNYLYSKELAYLTKQPYFMHSFWAALVSTLFGIGSGTIFLVLCILFGIICYIFYIIAWIKCKEIVMK